MRAKVCEQYMYYDAIDSGKYDVLTPGSLAMQAVKFAEYVYLEAEYPLAPGKENSAYAAAAPGGTDGTKVRPY